MTNCHVELISLCPTQITKKLLAATKNKVAHTKTKGSHRSCLLLLYFVDVYPEVKQEPTNKQTETFLHFLDQILGTDTLNSTLNLV
jgi:hypothetical protein